MEPEGPTAESSCYSRPLAAAVTFQAGDPPRARCGARFPAPPRAGGGKERRGRRHRQPRSSLWGKRWLRPPGRDPPPALTSRPGRVRRNGSRGRARGPALRRPGDGPRALWLAGGDVIARTYGYSLPPPPPPPRGTGGRRRTSPPPRPPRDQSLCGAARGPGRALQLRRGPPALPQRPPAPLYWQGRRPIRRRHPPADSRPFGEAAAGAREAAGLAALRANGLQANRAGRERMWRGEGGWEGQGRSLTAASVSPAQGTRPDKKKLRRKRIRALAPWLTRAAANSYQSRGERPNQEKAFGRGWRVSGERIDQWRWGRVESAGRTANSRREGTGRNERRAAAASKLRRTRGGPAGNCSGAVGAGQGAVPRPPLPSRSALTWVVGRAGWAAAFGTGAPNMSALLAALGVRERAATAAGGGQRGAARAWGRARPPAPLPLPGPGPARAAGGPDAGARPPTGTGVGASGGARASGSRPGRGRQGGGRGREAGPGLGARVIERQGLRACRGKRGLAAPACSVGPEGRRARPAACASSGERAGAARARPSPLPAGGRKEGRGPRWHGLPAAEPGLPRQARGGGPAGRPSPPVWLGPAGPPSVRRGGAGRGGGKGGPATQAPHAGRCRGRGGEGRGSRRAGRPAGRPGPRSACGAGKGPKAAVGPVAACGAGLGDGGPGLCTCIGWGRGSGGPGAGGARCWPTGWGGGRWRAAGTALVSEGEAVVRPGCLRWAGGVRRGWSHRQMGSARAPLAWKGKEVEGASLL